MRFFTDPLARRRWALFRANARGFWAFWLFVGLFLMSLFAPLIANDRPILASYKGELLFPLLHDYPESKFGGFLAQTNYRDPANLDEITANGWMVWPLIRYSYGTVNTDVPRPVPSPPVQRFAMAHPRAKPKPEKAKPDFDINRIAGLVDKILRGTKRFPQTVAV